MKDLYTQLYAGKRSRNAIEHIETDPDRYQALEDNDAALDAAATDIMARVHGIDQVKRAFTPPEPRKTPKP